MSARTDAAEALIFRARSLDLRALPRIDAHLHTRWTDGKPTVNEAYAAAVAAGLDAMLFTEHSRKTSTDWFPQFAAEVRSLPTAPCHAFVGTEVKVQYLDGTIDTTPAISDECDLITASVHRFPNEAGEGIPFPQVDPAEAVEREFALSWAALGNPLVDVLGHMFGMSLRRFNVAPTDEQIRALIRRAAETGVAIEVNAKYHTNPRQMIEWCQEFDATITFGSDAHAIDEIGRITRVMEGADAR